MSTYSKKRIPIQIIGVLLSTSFLSLTGCATMGAKLATHIAEKEERKDCSDTYQQNSVVDQETCERITRLIKKVTKEENGGFVAYDKLGRLKLKGTYENEDELNLAHMIVLTVVGTNGSGISPVTPKNLKEIKTVKSYVPQQSSGGKGDKYALLIGVSTFADSSIGKIQTAVKDVEVLKKSLQESGFKKIVTLTDKDATKNRILDEMRQLQGQVNSPNDSVVLYISTHGTPPDTFGKMGIFPYDIKAEILDKRSATVQEQATKISTEEIGDDAIIQIAKKRFNSLKTAVSFDDIQDFVTGVKTDKFVTILDTCYSGSALPALSPVVKKYADIERNISQNLGTEQKAELLGGSQAQACTVSEYPENLTRLKTAFGGNGTNSGTKGMYNEENATTPRKTNVPSIVAGDSDYMFDKFEQLKSAFSTNGVSERGKVLLTATNGKQQSLFDDPKTFNLSRDRLENSFFTFYLTKGLNKFNGQIFKAFDYAKVRTSNLVARDYPKNTQTPEMTGVPKQCINIDLSK